MFNIFPMPKSAREDLPRVGMRDLRVRMSEIVDDVLIHGQRYVICETRKPRAAIVPLADLERLLKLDERATRRKG